jgi:hypothetical protein
MKIEGQTSKHTVDSQMLRVGPRYFETMRLPLVRGRSLGPADIRGGPPAAVVNEARRTREVSVRTALGAQRSGSTKRCNNGFPFYRA